MEDQRSDTDVLPLLERDSQLAAADRLLAGASAGQSGTLVVEGRAGTGKSRLLDEIAERAGRAGLRVLRARGHEIDAPVPWALSRQLLPVAVAALPIGERVELMLEPAARRLLAHGQQELHDADPTPATLHALQLVVARVAAAGPLAVLVDDAHWADDHSLRLLRYVCLRAGQMPAALVVAVRPGLCVSECESLVAAHTGPLVQLAPLSEHAVAELAHAALGGALSDAGVARACELTAGNPHFLRCLLGAVAGRVGAPIGASEVDDAAPWGLERDLRRALRAGGAGAAALGQAAAVLGDGCDAALAGRLAGLHPAAALHRADRLAAADVLAASQPLRFAQPIVRHAIYASIPAGRRALLHAAAATLLRERGADVELTAGHLLHAPADSVADPVTVLEQAARRAIARGAPRAALRYLERALAEPLPEDRRDALLLELAGGPRLCSARGDDGLAAARVRPRTRSPAARPTASGSRSWRCRGCSPGIHATRSARSRAAPSTAAGC